MAERRASQFLVDVVLGAPGATYNSLQRGKALDPLPPALLLPEVTDLSKWWKGKHRYVDPEGQYVFVYQSSLYGPPVHYNTKMINLDSIRSVWDLLDPKWKGKMISLWPRANYVSTALLFMYHHPQIGPKFLERFYGGEMDLTYFSDFRQGTDWLASGKYPLCFLCRLRLAMEQGLPVAEISPYHFKEAPGIGSNNGAIVFMNSSSSKRRKGFYQLVSFPRRPDCFPEANNTNEDETTTSLREDLPLDVVPEAAGDERTWTTSRSAVMIGWNGAGRDADQQCATKVRYKIARSLDRAKGGGS